MANPVVCPRQPLPRDLDVTVNISRPTTEIATDMSLMCFLTPRASFPPNNGRVRYYSTMEAVETDFSIGSPAWWAANAFFSRQRHPLTMAIGRVFEDSVSAGMLTGPVDLAALNIAPNNQTLVFEVDDSLVTIPDLSFAGSRDMEDVASILRTEFATAGVPVTISISGGSLLFETTSTGDNASIGFAEEVISNTNPAHMLGMTQSTGASIWRGYEPEGLVSEATFVATASKCNGRSIYGWTIDAKYRDTDDQEAFADWIEARTPAYFSACTNSANAYNTQDTTNIGYHTSNKDYRRTSVMYHHNPQVYPDVSYIALALSTNYNLPDSALTMKFKQLEGIEASTITETMLSALISRNINCYVAIGNNTNTVREGLQGAPTWYTDTLVNLDNFREELQVEVFNVFLRTPKVPYTSPGQDMLVSAASKICRKYTRNGVFAPRDIEDERVESGYTTVPATTIIPVNVAFATMSERAGRIAPPIAIIAYEAGAFHKVTINVDVFN